MCYYINVHSRTKGLNTYSHSGKNAESFTLKSVVRIIKTGIYRVKEAQITPGLQCNFWSGGDNRDVMETG